ncbi:Hypothetical predicted protein [Prunus dulcis]|uniref:Uncharacterized protein n=1 Tax=Prunus dulcis TaxID=3755 RepID=A0A5E4G1F9_PRUDU|nr:Hypothetical predicted protein [Prunus dulcis]
MEFFLFRESFGYDFQQEGRAVCAVLQGWLLRRREMVHGFSEPSWAGTFRNRHSEAMNLARSKRAACISATYHESEDNRIQGELEKVALLEV